MNENAVQKLLERILPVEKVRDEMIAMGIDEDESSTLAEEIQDYIISSDDVYQFVRMLLSEVEDELDDSEIEFEEEEEEGEEWL